MSRLFNGSPVEYLTECIKEVLPDYANNIIYEAGFGIEEFVEKYAKTPPVCYITYEGFNELEIREHGRADSGETYAIYLRRVSMKHIDRDVRALRDFIALNSQFQETINGETNSWWARVGAGTPTLFTKGFDSFQLSINISQ